MLNSMQNILTGVVLHRRPYRETSSIVDFFTREHGRLSAVCRGVHGGKSAKSQEKKSLLQPFQALQLVFSGKSDLKTLVQVDSDGRGFSLQGNALFCALYLNELLNRLLPTDIAFPVTYDLYLASVLRLSENQSMEAVLREFEIHLLADLGYGFSWFEDVQSDSEIESNREYNFTLEQGFQLLTNLDKSKNHFSGESVLKAARYEWDKESLSTAKRVTRMALKPLLGDKPLKSRELFQKMEQTK